MGTERQRYQDLFEFVPDGYLVTDAEGTIREANRAAATLLNIPQENVPGQPLVGFIPAEERAAFDLELSRLRQVDVVQDWEVRLQARDGAPLIAAVTAAAVRNSEGTLTALHWLLRDLTERKLEAENLRESEERFRESEERFRSVTASAPIGIIQSDADRQCTFTNARWQAIFGMTLEESRGYGWSRALHLEDRETVLKGLAQAAREGREFSCEHRILTPQGVLRWVHARWTAMFSAGGNLTGYIATVEDITEAKQAREALRASEQRFQALTERNRDAVLLIAADGTVLYANPATTRILGYATDAVVGRNVLERLHPDDLPQVRDLAAQLLKQPGASITTEYRYPRKDGTWRWLEAVGANLLSAPSVQAIVVSYRDITERKQAAEEIRRHNQELEALNAITAAVGSSLELPEVLAACKRLAAEELGVPGGLIFFRDAVNDQLSLYDSWGLPEAILAELTTSPLTGYHYEPVIRAKEAILAPDFREVPLFVALNLGVARPEWQSYLCVPLLAEGEVEGVIGLFSQAPTVFGEDQLVFVKILGQAVGVAFKHARLFEQVSAGRERLQALSHRLVELQEVERQHIARELHDEVGQLLTGLKLSLELSAQLPADKIADRQAEALNLVNELTARVREMSLALRPTMLDDLGLLPALLWHFERYTALTNVRVTFEHTGLGRRFPPAVETAAYRIVQEALTNAARHAGVSEVMVRLWVGEDTLGMQIEDQGTGFDPSAVLGDAASIGLTGMRERAILLGGRLMVESVPGAGTSLTAELPLGKPVETGTEGEDDDRPGG
jgi:PAS domain S-box-containing protein